jgi:hypothetical protein
VTLDQDEKNLLVCYNPVKLTPGKQPEIVKETFLRRIPVDGSPATESTLGGDYVGNVVDLDASAQHFVGQDYTDHGLYLVDTATGKREFVTQVVDTLDGILLTSDASRLVFLNSGITFEINLGDLSTRKGWTDASYFDGYQQACQKFLTQLGFGTGKNLRWQWEEVKGLGSYLASVQVQDPAQPDKGLLLRYDIDKKQVSALWMPGGYLLPPDPALQGKNFDYYDAEKLAKLLLDRAGWMPAEQRVLYQPGPNPIYDKKSDSYVITFRSGYQLPSAETLTAYNREVSLRIGAKNGQLAEMTLLDSPEITGQPLKIQRKDLDNIARNYKQQPITETMPVKVDAQNARLVVYRLSDQGMKGAVYTGEAKYRLCWEVDLVSDPDKNLYFTYLIDTETGDILGSLSYVTVAPGATNMEQ